LRPEGQKQGRGSWRVNIKPFLLPEGWRSGVSFSKIFQQRMVGALISKKICAEPDAQFSSS